MQGICPAESVATPADGTGAGSRLDLHEELSTPRCTCGPEALRLRSDQGELVKPRGGCVNRCDYCAKLAAIENAEMLALDGMEGDAPEVWAVLTTRTATLCMESFYGGRRKVMLALRRRWPSCEYAALLEFTTGYGPRSGGQRRPHWNLLLKGIPAAECATAAEVIKRVWCGQVDAEPSGQHVGPIREAGGLMRYLALHFQKESQAPPAGFAGQRFNCSRGYFTGCTRAVARRRARESLKVKREVWKASRVHDNAHDVELAARESLELAYRTVWVLTNDRGHRVGKVAHRPASQALALGRTRLHERELIRLLVDELGAFEDWRDLVGGDRNPPQALLGASEGPLQAREQLRLTDQPGGGEGPSPGQVDPPKPPGVLVGQSSTRKGVSNGGRDLGAGELFDVWAGGSRSG